MIAGKLAPPSSVYSESACANPWFLDIVYSEFLPLRNPNKSNFFKTTRDSARARALSIAKALHQSGSRLPLLEKRLPINAASKAAKVNAKRPQGVAIPNKMQTKTQLSVHQRHLTLSQTKATCPPKNKMGSNESWYFLLVGRGCCLWYLHLQGFSVFCSWVGSDPNIS